MKNLLKKLTSVCSPSGFEDELCQVIKTEITPYADEIKVDKLGNLHAIKNGSDNNITIMLAAHMDEIGVIVTDIEEGGYARFTRLGYIYGINLVASRLIFTNGAIGMININEKDTKVDKDLRNAYIDFGVPHKDDCPVKVGDVACFFGPSVELTNSRYMAKSIDDRIGCAIQIELLKRLKKTPHNIHVVFTTQEEFSGVGARTSAYKITPDIAIAIDIMLSGDMPESKNNPVSLGKGPVIKVKDIGTLIHLGVKNWLIDTAIANDIPYQLGISDDYTDAMTMQSTKAGSAVGQICIPCRHIHTPAEIIDLTDAEHAVNLLVTMLSNDVPENLR
ncbi:MAG: hypothetical protein B6242_02305 [Anaerolineaceae bacterium 4572_78]|nr:MAG: hypothetical protein B6242_02305 [Anaerolineaceae bacterium 4572_78]